MYGGYYGYGYYFDPTYFLVLIGLVLCLGASALVNSTMRKYSKVRNMTVLRYLRFITLFSPFVSLITMIGPFRRAVRAVRKRLNNKTYYFIAKTRGFVKYF